MGRLPAADAPAIRTLIRHLYEHLQQPEQAPRRSIVDAWLLRQSIEALYVASRHGSPAVAAASGAFLSGLYGVPNEIRELETLAGLDPSLHQHAWNVLRIGRGLEGPALGRKYDK